MAAVVRSRRLAKRADSDSPSTVLAADSRRRVGDGGLAVVADAAARDPVGGQMAHSPQRLGQPLCHLLNSVENSVNSDFYMSLNNLKNKLINPKNSNCERICL